MSLTLSVTQNVGLTITPRDARGNPAPVDGIPVWEISDPSLASLVPSADGLSAYITALGGVGHAQVKVSADARMGPDVRTITGILELELVPAEAITLGITAGEPFEIADLPDPADPIPDPAPANPVPEPAPADPVPDPAQNPGPGDA